MSAQPYRHSATPTLAALRRTRAMREAMVRRILPLTLLAPTVVIFTSSRAQPHPGLHGAALGVSVALGCFALGGIGAFVVLMLRAASTRLYVPVLVVLMLSSAALVWLQPTSPGGPGAFGLIVAVGVAARMVPGRPSAVLLGLGLAVLVAAEIAGQRFGHRGSLNLLVSILPYVAIYALVLLGRRIRHQEEQTEQLLIELEETRGAELRAAALAERQRLARDMHDVLAHSLSGLVVQLEGARLLATSDPSDARLAVTIDRAHQLAKSGLDEARRAIGMLRGDELPGPGRLAALTRAFELDTGIPCRFEEAGEPRELASAVRLALYRVTQEALTNVRKHARPDRVEVHLAYRPGEVALAVEDFASGPARPPSPSPTPDTAATSATPAAAITRTTAASGYGLTGMRERAELLGGTLAAGPAGDGFLVQLRVPA